MLVEVLIVITGWAIGNVLFNAYERHVPPVRRLLKLLILIGLVCLLHVIGGRWLVFTVLALMALGMAVLHGWWFPKHGIHWRTAEPYDEYLKLTKKMKGRMFTLAPKAKDR